MASPIKTVQGKLDDAAQIIAEQQRELRELRKERAAQTKIDTEAETLRQEIFDLAAQPIKPPAWLNGVGIKGGERGGPCCILSDIHHGEVINPDEVAGVNEYNRKIAEKRIRRFAEVTIDLCSNHMGRAKVAYPGMVMCLGGDMISGDIHEELMRTNDRTAHESVRDLSDVLAGVIDQMATKFGRLFVPCVVGNHGRSTKKNHAKGAVTNNYDWTIYCNLERHFRKEKHIAIMVPNETDAWFHVFGHRYLLTHGDNLGVRGGDGIIGALGPIMRGRIKTANSEAQVGREFDTLLIGHWHQYLTLPGLICNNSVKGYDEYARLKLRAPYSRPSQALWFTHPEHGITAHWQVYLEPLRNKGPDNRVWVKWQA